MVEIRRSAFHDNHASRGGGAYVSAPDILIEDSTELHANMIALASFVPISLLSTMLATRFKARRTSAGVPSLRRRFTLLPMFVYLCQQYSMKIAS